MISLRDVVTGFGNRDPLAEVWRRSLRGGGGGSAVITGVPPLRYIGDGRPLTDYLLSGNTVQDGTPSSDAPEDATGCGVRTGNVMPAGGQKTVVSNGVTFSSDGNGRYRIHGTSTEYASARFYLASGFTVPISVSNNGQGTLSFFNTGKNAKVMIVFYNGTTKVDDWAMSSQNRTITTYNVAGNKYVNNFLIAVLSGETVDMIIAPEFTNDGVLPNEFEPYGHKLPLTVNSTEYPIYLGTVPTTRRVKKLVLTGEENWQVLNGNYYSSVIDRKAAIDKIVCSHFINSSTGGISYNRLSASGLKIAAAVVASFVASVADLKAWLSAQYTAGTPVTVWYVLAEPETAVVNEPLMKIGDYADTISFAQAGVTIPTVIGENVLDVPTEVPPSEITIKGGISSV